MHQDEAPASEPPSVPTTEPAPGTASDPSHHSEVGPHLLIDTPLGWLLREEVQGLVAEADQLVEVAHQEAAEARHEAAVARHETEIARHETEIARHERDRLSSRRAVRVATELANTAGNRTVRSLPRRLRSATEAREVVAPEPGPVGEPPPEPEVREARVVTARTRVRELDERGLLPPRPTRVPAFPHLRVLHLGATGRFLSLARHTALERDTWREQLEVGADLVLVEPPTDAPSWDPLEGELPALFRTATELGIPSVRLSVPSSRGGAGEPTLELVEGPPGIAGGDSVAPSIDTTLLNPTGWRYQPPDPVVSVLHRTPDGAARELLASFDPPVGLVHPTDLPSLGEQVGIRRWVSSPAGLRQALVRAGVLLDHPSWRGDSTETLRTWTASLACGTPVVLVDDGGSGGGELRLPDGGRLTLPPGVLVVSSQDAVETVHRLLIDPDLRERHGIVGRRWALNAGSREHVLREILGHLDVPVPGAPRTTVLLATNRPDFVERGLANVARQTQAGVDVSLVLHGAAFDGLDAPERGALVSSVVRAPERWTLGDCLNAALDRAQGELIAKMDDDDHYGPEHLRDLATAWGFSGADLVGKRIEYVHLAERGITVRRPSSAPERDRPHIGGPTLFGSRETLRRHRFLRVPNRVDSTLYERVLADGGRIYGIHSRDLVLERRGHGHAWETDDEIFLDNAIDKRPGLAIDLATSDPATGT
jgi:hypothetical protein